MSVNTSRKISMALHNSVKVALSPARGSFILLVKHNVWGLAKVIYNVYTYGNKSMLARWKIGWFNLGGDWGKFANAISKGYNKKPFALKLAPQQIKNIYASSGKPISGVGVGSVAGTVAILSAAATVITALMPLLQYAFQSAASSGELPQEDTQFDFTAGMNSLLSDSDYQKQILAKSEELPYLTKEQADIILKGGSATYGSPVKYSVKSSSGKLIAVVLFTIFAGMFLKTTKETSIEEGKK